MISMQAMGTRLAFAASLTLLVGCGTQASQAPAGDGSATNASAAGAAYLLDTEPAAAIGVKQARADAKHDEPVTLVGRIGGDTNPWIDGQAAFLIVDSALKPCNEKHDDSCPTPWDYCCDAPADLTANKALVEIVDADGKPIATGAKELLGVKELQTVVVQGTAKRDEAGNLTVLAAGIFVKQ
jgi:hypothetical protein